MAARADHAMARHDDRRSDSCRSPRRPRDSPTAGRSRRRSRRSCGSAPYGILQQRAPHALLEPGALRREREHRTCGDGPRSTRAADRRPSRSTSQPRSSRVECVAVRRPGGRRRARRRARPGAAGRAGESMIVIMVPPRAIPQVHHGVRAERAATPRRGPPLPSRRCVPSAFCTPRSAAGNASGTCSARIAR